MWQNVARSVGAVTPFQWLLLAIAGGIVALYFLKLRRTPQQVPSTYLWLRAVEDMHVNSLFQRLRRNLLLFLQLVVIALVFSAFFPLSCTVNRDDGLRYIFLIDNSASMSANDVKPSRLEQAKQQALNLVDQMTHREDAAMVMTFSNQARVVCPFTRMRSHIREAIGAIQPTETSTSLFEALTVASGLANPGSTADQDIPAMMAAELYLFTDGGFSDVQDFALGNLKPHYMTIGASSRNVGIAAMNTRIHEEHPDQLQVFARAENFSLHEQGCPQAEKLEPGQASEDPSARGACTCPALATFAELFLDEDPQPKDAQRLEIKPGESQGLTFDFQLLSQGVLKLKLDVDDDLAVDNVAWTAVNPPRPARVLHVGPEDNLFLEYALRTPQAIEAAHIERRDPSFLQTADYRQAADAGDYDLMIYDRCAPETMPACNTWFIGRLAPLAGLTSTTRVDWPIILDTDHVHPIMHYVGMSSVEIGQMHKVDLPVGATSLVQTDQGPALLLMPREGFRDLLMTFELVSEGKVVREGWQTHQSFPVFVFNVLRELGRGGAVLARESIRPGQPMTLHARKPFDTVTVLAPDGGSHQVPRGTQGSYLFSRTERNGVYEVRWPEQELHEHFTVNLFDAAESNIAPRTQLEIGYEAVQAAAQVRPSRQELWKYFLLAALGVLLVEWYVYQRRVYF